ncbi:50S ribosomal protein L32 [Candidatus Hodgkinia cicadicola]|nr:50S ribosomal protein L32 [Candidatus Hodgkinia cicadicola]
MAAPKRKVSLSKRGAKRKRLRWHGFAAGTRFHHVNLMFWKYKAERLNSVSIADYY